MTCGLVSCGGVTQGHAYSPLILTFRGIWVTVAATRGASAALRCPLPRRIPPRRQTWQSQLPVPIGCAPPPTGTHPVASLDGDLDEMAHGGDLQGTGTGGS